MLAIRSRHGDTRELLSKHGAGAMVPCRLDRYFQAPLVIQQVGRGHVRICGHLQKASQGAEWLYEMLLARGNLTHKFGPSHYHMAAYPAQLAVVPDPQAQHARFVCIEARCAFDLCRRPEVLCGCRICRCSL